MSTDLTTTTAGLPANYGNPFAEAGAGAGATTFVKFQGSSGDFLAGPEEEELAHNTPFAADIMNSRFIWSFWWESEVLETRETFVRDNPLGWDDEPDDLPEGFDGGMTIAEIRQARKDDPANFRDGWSVQASLNLRPLDGSDEEYTLKLNAGVAMNGFRALLSAFGRQFRVRQGLVPIITFTTRKYKSKVKSVGTRHAPIFKIVDWKSEEELAAAVGDDPADYDDTPDTGPVTQGLPAPEAQTAPADAQEPVRRGRRGARGNFG